MLGRLCLFLHACPYVHPVRHYPMEFINQWPHDNYVEDNYAKVNTKANGPYAWGIGIGLVKRFRVRILASPRTDMSRTVSPSAID